MALASHRQMEEAMVHYQDALKVNPQYPSAWFRYPSTVHSCGHIHINRLGCCSLILDQHLVAQRAFTRCVQLMPEDGEAWNNLAGVYMKVGKKYAIFTSWVASETDLMYTDEKLTRPSKKR